MDALCRVLRCGIAPELIDDPVVRQRRAGMEEQQREQCALPPRDDAHGAVIVLDLEQAEQPELHLRRR